MASLNRAFISFVVELTAESTQFEERLGRVQQRAAAVGASLAALGGAAAGGLALAAREAINFESAFAGIEKTVEATPEEFARLNREIRDLSLRIPVAADELARIGEIGGQLGVKSTNIASFTSLIADLSVATDLTSESAATMVAQFGNVAGVPQENYRQIGDIVVELGNNFATTESRILEMGQRLAASGRIAGLAAPETLALAAALSSVGIEAEAGGTAFSKLLVAISSNVESGGELLNEFATIAGQSAEDFADNWRKEPAQALRAFIEGLGGAEEAGVSLFPILEKLEITETRMRNAVSSAALAHKQFGEALDRSKDAAADGNQLQDEAAKRYATTAEQLNLLRNEVTYLATEIGTVMLPAIRDFVAELRPAIHAIAEFAEGNPELTATLVAVTGALAGLGTGVGAFLYALPRLTEGFGLVKTAATNLIPFLSAAGPAAGLAGAALAAGAAFLILNEDIDKTYAQIDRFKAATALQEALENVGVTIRRVAGEDLEAYIRRLQETAEQHDIAAEAFGLLKRPIGEISKELEAHNKAALEGAKAYEQLEIWQQRVAAGLEKIPEKIKLTTEELKNLGGASADIIKKPTPEEIEAYWKRLEQAAKTYAELDDAARAASEGVERFQGSISPVGINEEAEAARKAAEETRDFAAGLDAVGESLRASSPQLSDWAAQADSIAASVADVNAAMAEWNVQADEAAAANAAMRGPIEEANRAQREQNETVLDAAGAYGDLGQEIPKSREEMKEFGRVAQQVSTIVNDVAKSIAAAFVGGDRREFNAGLRERVEDLKKDLIDSQTEFDEFIQGSEDQFAELSTAYSKSLDDMQRDYDDSLDKQRESLDKFVADAEATFAKTQQSLLDREAEQLNRLIEQLDDRRQRLEDAERDTAQRIADIRRDEIERTGDARAKYNLELQSRQRDFAQYRAKILRDIAELDRGDEKSAAKQERTLRQSLADREQDLQDWMQDQEARLALETSIAERENGQRVADLNEGLDEQRAAYEQYVVDVNEEMTKVRAETQTRLDEERADLEASITDRIAQYERFRSEAAAKLEEQRADALAKYQQDTADLEAEVAKRTSAFEQFKLDTATKLGELTEKFRTLGGDILKVFTEDLPNALTRFVSEYLVGKLFDKLGKLAKEILPGIAEAFGGIFGSDSDDGGGWLSGIGGGGGAGGGGAGGLLSLAGSNPWVIAAIAGASFLGGLLGGPDNDTVNLHTLETKNEVSNLRADEWYRFGWYQGKWDMLIQAAWDGNGNTGGLQATLWGIEGEVKAINQWKPMIESIDLSAQAVRAAFDGTAPWEIAMSWETSGDAVLDAISRGLSARASLGRG